MSYIMKRILITGVNGLVGTNFTNSWSANHMDITV